MAKRITFTWTHGGQRESGEPVDVAELEFRLYENGEMIVDNIGELQFSLLMDDKPNGVYKYEVTAVDRNGLESDPSNTIEVNFYPPAAPDGLTASWAD